MSRIENALIKDIMLGCEDHGIFTCMLCLEGNGWIQDYGGYELDAWDEGQRRRTATKIGLQAIMDLLKTLEVSRWGDLKGKYVRIEVDGIASGTKIKKIGHIIKDKWFSFEDALRSNK